MNTTWTFLDIAGAIALLLWGVHMVQTGIQRAFGADLRRLLGAALRNRLAAFATGLGVTAILQSSTATGLMLTGFAAGGAVDLVPALAVMLGANVGTTLIVQALSFDVASVSPSLILMGVILFRRGTQSRTRDLGRVTIGLGLMLLSLHQVLVLVSPLEDVPSLRMLLGAIADQPLLDVALAAVLTWAAHSSVTVVLLVMSFASRGVVPPHAAFALVLGANLGSALNPVLEGGAGGDPVARRLPVGNLLNRVIGCVLALAGLRWIGPFVATSETDLARLVADFHTGFNVVLAALFLPLLQPYARLLQWLLPARLDPHDPTRTRYLDTTAFEQPPLAIAGAAREALRVSDLLDQMLRAAADALSRADRLRIANTRRFSDLIEKLNAAISQYLGSLDRDALTEADEQRRLQILTFISQLAAAAEIVDREIMANAARRLKRGLPIPAEESAEASQLFSRLLATLRSAAAVFMSSDVEGARRLIAAKEDFRALELAATQAQFANPADGGAGGTLRLELLRALRQINSRLAEAAAYPVLESQGEVVPRRLRAEMAEE
ncbi:MAG: Na/Pi cotransporter family protein [Acetobacteraceae bacterium]|nr:Na/Pi cotransporter family protein [Acetobacteraceae bacterium]